MLEKLHISPECDGFLFLAESVRNPPVLYPHRHIELELNLVTAGQVTYVVDGRTYHFPTGSLLWMFPEQVHQLVDRTPDAAYFVAVFRPRMLRQTCRTGRYAPLRHAAPPARGVMHTLLPEDRRRDLAHMLQDLTGEGLDPDLLNREAGFGLTPGFQFRHGDPDGLNAGLRHLLLRAWRLQRPEGDLTRAPLHPAVRRALDDLNNSDPLPALPELAGKCGVAASTLSRLFSSEMGVPLSQYRNSLRLSRFMHRMSGPEPPSMLEAALDAGFGSYAQFYRVFNLSYGVSPREAMSGRPAVQLSS